MEGEDNSQHSSAPNITAGMSANKQAAQREKQWDRQMNFGQNFSKSSSHIPLERLVKLHNYEMLEVLLMMVMDNFKMSRTPITSQLTQTMTLVQEKTDAKKVQEIRRQFLSDGKIHFQ